MSQKIDSEESEASLDNSVKVKPVGSGNYSLSLFSCEAVFVRKPDTGENEEEGREKERM